MVLKTIKNVDDETWYRFKNLAVKNRITMGELLKKMILKYEQTSTEFWKAILSGERILSDEEAKALHANTKRLRKEHGFRK